MDQVEELKAAVRARGEHTRRELWGEYRRLLDAEIAKGRLAKAQLARFTELVHELEVPEVDIRLHLEHVKWYQSLEVEASKLRDAEAALEDARQAQIRVQGEYDRTWKPRFEAAQLEVAKAYRAKRDAEGARNNLAAARGRFPQLFMGNGVAKETRRVQKPAK